MFDWIVFLLGVCIGSIITDIGITVFYWKNKGWR